MATVNLTVEQYLANPVINPTDDVTIVDTGVNIAALTDADFAGLAAAGVDAINSDNDVLTLSALQAAALGEVDLNADDLVTIGDTGTALAALTAAQITILAGNNVDAINSDDDALTLSAAQALALGSIVIADADNATVQDTADSLELLTPAQIEQLAARNIDSVDSLDQRLAVDVAQLQAFLDQGVTFTAGDSVTLAEFSDVLNGGNAEVIGDLAGQGISFIDSLDDQLTYSIEMVQALGTVQLTAADVVTVQDTAAAFAALTPIEVAFLATKNVDLIDLDTTGGPITLTVSQLRALGDMTFVPTANVTLDDTGSNIATLSPTQIAALEDQGIDTVDASGGSLQLSVSQYKALGSVEIAAGVAVSLYGTVVEINGLTDPEIAALATAGIAFPELRDSGAALTALTDADFTALAAKGVTSIDATDDAFSLTVAELRALGSIQLAAADTITLSDTTAELATLSPEEVAALEDQGIDVVDPTDDVPPPAPVTPAVSISDASVGEGGVATFTVTLSQATTGTVSVNYGTSPGTASVADFIATGGTLTFGAGETSKQVTVQTVQDNLFEGDETFTLALSNVSGGTLADAEGVGLIASDGPASTIGRGTSKSDTIKGSYRSNSINGNDGNDKIFGNGGNDSLKGGDGKDKLYGGNENDNLQGQDGNDLLFGGAGKDSLKGGAGRDAFAFDTAPNRNNVDKIVDFNVRDDSVYLDNAVFTALGSKGSLGSPAKLKSSFFTIGSKAKDKNDHVIYDNKKGVLLYDADGKGGDAAVQIATVNKNLKMTYNDFFVI